jgi:5-methyltetrahydropteroyltriglutamate--homocysteine methyltransferase
VAARADTVSILLRPPELQAAREPYAAGYLSAAEFKRIEDKAVDEALKLQEEEGFSVVTYGEMRRESLQSQPAEAVEGLGDPSIDAYLWGDWKGGEEVGDRRIARPESLGVVGKLGRRRYPSVGGAAGWSRAPTRCLRVRSSAA